MWLFLQFGAQPSSIPLTLPQYPGLSLTCDISPTLSLSQSCCLPASAQIKYLTHSVPIWKTQCPLKSCSPPGGSAQHWEVLPSPATGAKFQYQSQVPSGQGCYLPETVHHKFFSTLPLVSGVIIPTFLFLSSAFGSHKNRYIIFQKQKNQRGVLLIC